MSTFRYSRLDKNNAAVLLVNHQASPTNHKFTYHSASETIALLQRVSRFTP